MSTRSDRRSTSSKDSQGSAADRRRRKEWLVAEFRADTDVLIAYHANGHTQTLRPVSEHDQKMWLERLGVGISPIDWAKDVIAVQRVPACRCYRCGALLTAEDVSPDRWPILGCDGGTYRRGNIRPTCLSCNIRTGSAVGHARRAKNGVKR